MWPRENKRLYGQYMRVANMELQEEGKKMKAEDGGIPHEEEAEDI